MVDNLAPSLNNSSISRLSKGVTGTIGHWFKKVLVGMARQYLAMKLLSGSRARKFRSIPTLYGISNQVLRLV
jgi:hypothetical protein